MKTRGNRRPEVLRHLAANRVDSRRPRMPMRRDAAAFASYNQRGLEFLESRVLLSITAAQFNSLAVGSQRVYTITQPNSPGSSTKITTTTAVLQTTYNGHAATELDTSEVDTSADVPPVLTTLPSTKVYAAMNATGIVNYGGTGTMSGVTNKVTGDPYVAVFPASLSAGQPITYTHNATVITSSTKGNSTAAFVLTETYSLASETTVPVQVPAGMFNCYVLTVVSTRTGKNQPTTTSTETDYYATGVGEVKSVSGTGTDEIDKVLDSYVNIGGHLFFFRQPQNGQVNNPIPLGVELLDGDGQIDRAASGTISLSLVTNSGGIGAVLSGTITLPLITGVAVFAGTQAPKISEPGNYSFTAAVSGGSSVRPLNSSPFNITGDRLVIRKQPPQQADVGQQLPLIVELVDKQGNVDTSENAAQVQLSLQSITGAPGSQLKGTTTVTFVNGVATFTATSGPSITGIGTFKLLVNEIGSDNPVPQISTTQITTTGYHLMLKYTNHPGGFRDDRLVATGADIQPGATFSIYLLDKQNNRVQGLSAAQVKESLTTLQGNGQIPGGEPIVSFDTSSQRYDLPADVTSAGVYSFDIVAVDTPGADIPAAAIAPLMIGPIHVDNPVMNASASTRASANKDFDVAAFLTSPEPFIANLGPNPANFRHVFVPTVSVGVSVSIASGPAGGQIIDGNAFPIFATATVGNQQGDTGETTNLTPRRGFIAVNEPGAYQLVYTEVITPDGQPFDPNNFAPVSMSTPVMVKVRVASDKPPKFTEQPPNRLTSGQTFSVTLALVDAQGKPVVDFDNTPDDFGDVVAVKLSAKSQSGAVINIVGAVPTAFVNGVAVFTNLSFGAPGLYTIHATQIYLNPTTGDTAPQIFGPVADGISSLVRVTSG